MVCQSYSARSYVTARSPTRVVDRLQEPQPFDTACRNPVSDPTVHLAAQKQSLFMQTKQIAVDRTAMMKFTQLSTNRVRRKKTCVLNKDLQHLAFSHADMQVCNALPSGHI